MTFGALITSQKSGFHFCLQEQSTFFHVLPLDGAAVPSSVHPDDLRPSEVPLPATSPTDPYILSMPGRSEHTIRADIPGMSTNAERNYATLQSYGEAQEPCILHGRRFLARPLAALAAKVPPDPIATDGASHGLRKSAILLVLY